MKVGFIGLGAMGTPMARNVACGGFLSAVWNRTEASAFALARELNVTCAASPSLLAAHSDVILTCVSADEDVSSVVESMLPGVRADTIVVDFSTVSADTARHAAARLREKGADFLDAPVSGGVEGAQQGTLAIMVGGRLRTLEIVRPILDLVGGHIAHMGDVGSGQATKAVNQIMAAGINQAVTEALAFAEAQGLNLRKVIDIVARGAAGNWFLDKRGLTMTQGIFKPGFKVRLHLKDLKICERMAEQVGMRLPVTEMTVADYSRLIRENHGDEDISALYRLKKPAS